MGDVDVDVLEAKFVPFGKFAISSNDKVADTKRCFLLGLAETGGR